MNTYVHRLPVLSVAAQLFLKGGREGGREGEREGGREGDREGGR